LRKIATTKEEKEYKANRIKKVELDLFAKHGYHQITMSEIASAACIGRGTLYWYFDSKEKLFIEALNNEIDQMIAESKEFAAQDISPQDKLYLAMEELPRGLDKYSNLMHSLLQVWGGDMQKEIIKAGERLNKYDHTILTEIVKEGIEQKLFRPANPSKVAAVLMAISDGAYYHCLLGFAKADPGYIEATRDIIFQGILCKEHANLKIPKK